MDNKKCIPIYGSLSQASGSSGGGIIPTGTKEINITENGESDHDVTDYATAHVTVNVPKPTAKKTVEITENGTTTEDVADFGSIDIAVNVAGQTTDQWKDVLYSLVAGDVMQINELTLSVPYVRRYAFYYTTLPATFTLEGTSNINEYAFAYTDGVKTMNINSVTALYQYSFYRATSLVTINAEAIEEIPSYCLYYCYALKTLNAPNVKNLVDSSIVYCSILEEIYFPKLTFLGNKSISNMPHLKKVTFGDVQLKDNALYTCPELETLDVKTSSSIYIPKSLSKSLIIRDITAVPTMMNTVSTLKDTLNVYVPDDLVGAFKEATNWSEFGDRIKPLSEYVEL